MTFAEPLWLPAGLIACGALAWAWRNYDARQQTALAAFASPHLHRRFTASISHTGRNWKRGLLLAAVACLFAALARPQAGFKWEEVKQRGVEVVFAVDTSRSMLTPDVKPDRLTRAKLAVDDFVSRMDDDGIGLIAFAGNAFLQCPITLDHDAFHESLAALDTTIIPRGGTDIASAIEEARIALQNRPSDDKIMILLTDGEDLEGDALAAAKTAAKVGVKIYAVGVGTANGDLIPLPNDQGGGFVKDGAGQFVKSRLDEAGLKAIAGATGGLYAPLGAQGQGLDYIYRRAIAPPARHDLASRRQRVYLERFQWPLAAALAFLLTSLPIGTRRRGSRLAPEPARETARPAPFAARSALALGLLLLLAGQPAKASPATAEKAYRTGDFATAEREYAMAAQSDAQKPVLQFNAGSAAYKAGRFSQAAEAFQSSLRGEASADFKRLAVQEDAYYNLGNALYRTGQKTEQSTPEQTIKAWEQAVKTYEAALQLRSADADARFNRDFVQKKLAALKKRQQERKQSDKQGQSQENQKPQGRSGSKSDENNQRNQGQDSGQPGQNRPAGAQPKPEQQRGRQSASDGAKSGQSPRPERGQPKPAAVQPQSQGQNPAGEDQGRNPPTAADANREPGEMSPEEARELLNSVRGEEQPLPAAPVARGANEPPPGQPGKDW